MINLVIMVHSSFSEQLLTLKFSRIPQLKMISIPVQQSTETFSLYSLALSNKLEVNQINDKNLDYLIVESNYGKHGDDGINTELLNFVLARFPNTKIFVFGNTPQSLGNALVHHSRLQVLKNNTDLEKELIASYPQFTQKEISDRVYSMKRLEVEIIKEKEDRKETAPLLPQYALRANAPVEAKKETPSRIEKGPSICGPG